MKQKKKNDRNTDIVYFSSSYTNVLENTNLTVEFENHMKQFLMPKDSDQQISASKAIAKYIQENPSSPIKSAVISLLCHAYIKTHVKNPLKRALASSLQATSGKVPETLKILCSHVKEMFLTEISLQLSRAVIDNALCLTENFSLGNECLSVQWHEGICYVEKTLALYTKAYKNAVTPVAQTERMHDLLVTVQVWNKLIQRSENAIETLFKTSTSEDKENILQTVLVNGLASVGELMNDDGTVMDVRLTCGITFPLMIKSAYPCETISQILCLLFSGVLKKESVRSSVFENVCSRINKTDVNRICLLNGCLAMLNPVDLSNEYEPDRSFLVDTLATELLHISSRLQDTNSKIIASRTLVLWTQKARLCLETMDSDLLRRQLKGFSRIPKSFLQYTWTHWEHPVDTIRHHSRTIFEQVFQCHFLATKEDPLTSEFLVSEVEELMTLGWHIKGKYGPLCCIVDLVGPKILLELQPELPITLLNSLSEQTLAYYVCELYEKSFTKAKGAGCDEEEWLQTWVEPLLKTLCCCSKTTKTHIIEYIIPKLLKCAPSCLSYITTKMANHSTSEDSTEKLGALVTCLKRAKVMGLLEQKESHQLENGKWRNVVFVNTLRQALCCHDEQVSLDALGLLCENNRSTEAIPKLDLELIQLFLSYRMSSQSPSFRQQLVASLKKLFIRLKEGSHALLRKAKDSRNPDQNVCKEVLKTYKTFLSWLCSHCLQLLHPSAAFPSRTSSLSVLSMLVHIYGAETHEDDERKELLFSFSTYLGGQPQQIENLLCCFTDTFENNKVEIFSILNALPFFSLNPEYESHPAITYMSVGHASKLLNTALELSSSTRPQDSTTAAYLLKILVKHYNLAPHLKAVCDKNTITCNEKIIEPSDNMLVVAQTRRLLILEVLLNSIKEQVSVARQSLLHAAATRPLYPTLHCIRYIMADQDLKNLEEAGKWQDLVASLVDVCFEIATTVSPVVSNSSPEGNIPEDAILGPGLTLDAVVESDVDKELLSGTEESVKTVNLMPEYLVVCCWRSIKEVSLLLGQLTQTAPLKQPEGEKNECTGLLSVKQINDIGEYFTKQLLESRHRGAFELAYAGFVKMTEMLWRCRVEGVYSLPGKWLDQIVKDISAHDPTDRLCSTRRSAGVPFYVQALVSTEPAKAGRKCFKKVMLQLLHFSQPDDLQPSKENTSQVHSLNVMRALFRDTRLADDVFPFIADGMKAAIRGYMSQLWSIRNSSTLLFSALMTRVFGVKRSKDDASKKNCLTGRVFFHRFPSLFEFLLEHLNIATEDMSDGSKLHPGLYPVLMVLGRLFPSVIEGVDSNLNIAAFIPAIVKCASSPVYKTRLMSARAVRPLVSKDNILNTLQQLTALLPGAQSTRKSISARVNQNLVHGALLQIEHILRDVQELPSSLLPDIQKLVIDSVLTNKWLITNDNPCISTREAFAKTVFTTVSIPASNPGIQAHFKAILSYLIKQTHAGTAAIQVLSSTPGLAQFEQTLTKNLLHCLDNQSSLQVPSQLSAVDLIQQMLTAESYEVRWETLEYLLKFGKYREFCSEEYSEDEIASRYLEENLECRKTREEMNSSELVFKTLVALLLGKERHQECLVKVCYALCQHTSVNSFPWHTASREYSSNQILKYLFRMQTSSRDEVRCAALELSGIVVQHVLGSDSQDQDSGLLGRWIGIVEDSCSTEKSVLCRLTCARVLVSNAEQLFIKGFNGGNRPGLDAVLCWTVYVRLLQDEDVDVRQTASSALTHLQQYIPPQYQQLLEVRLNLESTLVLDLSLLALVNIMRKDHWKECINLLIKFTTEELEEDWLAQEDKAVRLFDKGEMNTYRDELSFSYLTAMHLEQLVNEITAPVQDEAIYQSETEQEKFVHEKHSEINGIYRDKTALLKDSVEKNAFLESTQVQCDREQLARFSLALAALSCDNKSDVASGLDLKRQFGIWSHFSSSE